MQPSNITMSCGSIKKRSLFWPVLIHYSCFANPLLALELDLPIDCKMGNQYFIQNYVDNEVGKGWKDYHCGIFDL